MHKGLLGMSGDHGVKTRGGGTSLQGGRTARRLLKKKGKKQRSSRAKERLKCKEASIEKKMLRAPDQPE